MQRFRTASTLATSQLRATRQAGNARKHATRTGNARKHATLSPAKLAQIANALQELLESLGVTYVVNCTVPRDQVKECSPAPPQSHRDAHRTRKLNEPMADAQQGGLHNFFEKDGRFRYLRCPTIDSDCASLKEHFEVQVSRSRKRY